MSYQIRVKYPFFGGDKADGRWQMADGRRKKRLQPKRGLSRRIWYQFTYWEKVKG
ncbi:MAG TPA: hypothetical protein V6C90_06035 [Coleofasciculaceae cyanobacterium]